MQYIGFNPALESQHTSEEDWIFGAASDPGIASIPESEREQYLPIGERQGIRQDTSDCATRDFVNGYENQFTYLYRKNLLTPENRKWLDDNGYVVGDRIVLSDAYIAILSGTTRTGNSLKAPIDKARTAGLIPKAMLPLEDWMMWQDYHNPARITEPMKRLGQEFARRFVLNYEKVYSEDFERVLKTDMLCVACHAWPVPVNGEYPKVTGEDFNHAVLMWRTPKYYIFDNYVDDVDGDYIKKLAADYIFYPYGYRIYISKQTTPEERAIANSVNDVLAKYGLQWIFDFWWHTFNKVRGLFGKRP